ncbi:hypothetical protein ACFL09_07095, partial [Planctomycetota bacterium]
VACACPVGDENTGKTRKVTLMEPCMPHDSKGPLVMDVETRLCTSCAEKRIGIGKFIRLRLTTKSNAPWKLIVQIGNEEVASAWAEALRALRVNCIAVFRASVAATVGTDIPQATIEKLVTGSFPFSVKRIEPGGSDWASPMKDSGGCALALIAIASLLAASAALVFLCVSAA